MMRVVTAHVRNGRLVIDQPADLPDGTCIELVRVDANGGDLPDAEKCAKLARELNLAFAEQEAGQLLGAITDEHVRWYQESMPDSPTTRDVITAATSDLPVLRWLGRRRIAARINACAKRLGMAPVSMSRWIGRRKLPPVFLLAHVGNGRLVLDEPTEHPDGTLVELVPTDSVM